MKSLKILFILSVLTGITAFSAFAQKKPYNEEITVVAPYQPDIKDAGKINFTPEIKDSTEAKPGFTYKILSKPVATTFTPAPIEPAKMLKEPITKLYSHYLKAGYGTYKTPYGEYFYQNTRSREYSYGAHLRHLSSTGKIEKYAYRASSENSISIYGKQFKDKKYNLSGQLGFSRDVVHYYGLDIDETDQILLQQAQSVLKKTIRQRFSSFDFKGACESSKTDSAGLTWNSGLKFYHFFDRFDTRETNIRIDGSVGKSGQFVDLSPSQEWDLGMDIDFYNDKSKAWKSHSSAIIMLSPSITTKIKDLGIHIGLKPAIEADSSAYLHLYPDIKFTFRAIPLWLNLYAGFDGGIERNSYRAFAEENPFVEPTIQLSYKKTKYRFYGGINSTLFRMFDLHVMISRAQIENMPFYINDTNQLIPNQFLAMYDDDAGLFEFNSELAYQYNEAFRFLFRFNYHQYSTSFKRALPWQRPDYDLSASVAYNMQNKILAAIDFIYYDRMYALTYNSAGKIESKFIRNRPDLNISFEYRYTKMFSLFLKLNNIANVRYYYWNNYPSQKFNLLGGITCSF